MQAAERQSRRQVPELHRECPVGLSHIWSWLSELRAWRNDPNEAQSPLTFSEIDAWARLTRRRPTVDEVHTLRMLSLLMRSEAQG